MCEIGDLQWKYTVIHENIWSLILYMSIVLYMSIAILGRNKMQMYESRTQCVRVGRSE